MPLRHIIQPQSNCIFISVLPRRQLYVLSVQPRRRLYALKQMYICIASIATEGSIDLDLGFLGNYVTYRPQSSLFRQILQPVSERASIQPPRQSKYLIGFYYSPKAIGVAHRLQLILIAPKAQVIYLQLTTITPMATTTISSPKASDVVANDLYE